MKKSVLTYVFSLAPFAFYIFAKAGFSLTQGDWLTMMILTIMFILLEKMAIRLPSGPIISLTSGLSMVAIFCFGVEKAIFSATVSMFLISFINRWEYYKAIYNTSLYIISIYAAGVVFSALGGMAGIMDIMIPWSNIGAILTYFFVNSLLTAGLFSLLQEKNIFSIWYTMIGDSFLVYVAVQILSLTSTYMYLNQGIVGVIMLISFLFMLQMVFRSHYRLFEKEKERAVEFEAILNTAQSGILMIDRFNKVKMVNKKFQQLFGTGEHLRGESINELFQALSDKLVNLEIFKQLLEKNKYVQIIEAMSPSGEKKIFQASIAAIDEEEEVGKIITLTDITSEWKKNKQLKELYESAIRSLAAAVDTKDAYTSGHSNRVADLAVNIGRKIGLPDNEVEVLRYAGLLHDIGKIGIDDKILRKPGPLDNSEWIQMKEHPIKGVAILDEVQAFQELIPIIKYHHEKFDGNGYIEGLKGENIPIGSRILAIADSFDAMTSNRSYRKALTATEALQRLISGKASQFDPYLVDTFIAMVEQGEIDLDKHKNEALNTSIIFLETDEKEIERSKIANALNSKILSTLYQISLENYSSLQLKSYLSRLLEILYDSLGENLYSLYFFDDAKKIFKLHSFTGVTNNSLKLPNYITADDGRIQDLIRLRELKISMDENQHILPCLSKKEKFSCEVLVPINNKENILGFLWVKVCKNLADDELYLLTTLANQIGQIVKISQTYQDVLYESRYDYLTNVLNRGSFIKSLQDEMNKAERQGYPLSLCIIDIDNFKELNDRFGHLIGDIALKDIATYLKENIRGTDIVGRYGGDEFAIIFPGCNNHNAVNNMNRMMEDLNIKKFHTGKENITLPAASYGIATFPNECTTIEQLFKLADDRMYLFKRTRTGFASHLPTAK